MTMTDSFAATTKPSWRKAWNGDPHSLRHFLLFEPLTPEQRVELEERRRIFYIDPRITDPQIRAEILTVRRIMDQHRRAGTMEQYDRQLREDYPQQEEEDTDEAHQHVR